MSFKTLLRAATVALMIVFVTFMLIPGARAASKFQILHNFTEGDDGGEPHAGLIFDSAGNLYGTTFYGGTYNQSCPNGDHRCGAVFKLTPNPDGSWTETVLFSPSNFYDFPNSLTFDSSGNLYGTLCCGALNGAVFTLIPNLDGTWTESDLYGFGGGEDGMFPSTALTIDTAGSLYGATYFGGNGGCDRNWGCGTVYKLTANGNGGWTENVLYRFSGGEDGGYPGNFPTNPTSGKLVFDAAGNLYGTTSVGGAHGYGVVFQLTPQPDGTWAETVLHSFTGGKDGTSPLTQLVSDNTGNLYGADSGGGANGCGVLFELKNVPGNGWKGVVLHSFKGQPACNPVGALAFSAAGDLYGVTLNSPDCSYYQHGCGTVFKFDSGTRSFRVLHVFTGDDGATPDGGLIVDGAGNLFGTTIFGGTGYSGTAFEIMP